MWDLLFVLAKFLGEREKEEATEELREGGKE